MFLSEGIAATSFFYGKVRMTSSATSSAFGPVAPTGKNPFPSLFQGECGPCSLAGGAHLGLCFHYHTPLSHFIFSFPFSPGWQCFCWYDILWSLT